MIKFRAWDKENNKFFKPTYRAYVGELEYLSVGLEGRLMLTTIEGNVDESMFPERFILMQSTGLFDKNGVEVFEGDILYYPEQDEDNYGYIEFDKDRLAFVLDNGFEKFVYGEYGMSYIVGNIYENPELIESVEE